MSSDDIYTIYNIDKSKLKRDYIKYPLLKNKQGHFIETISIEEIKYLYIYLNCPRTIVTTVLNITDIALSRFLKKYQIKKPINLHQQNIQHTKLIKYGNAKYVNIEKYKQTCLNKYGVPNYSYTTKFKQQVFEKKNSTNVKIYQTKKKNNSFNTSKPEEEIYKLLCQKYNDVKRQYKSKVYPFACDFYIPSEDLYIEYQGFWTHGNEPYDENNQRHQEKLKLWETKGTSQYKKAINDWTQRDIIKRKTAKNNNLNWLEFFTEKEFMIWFTKLT